YTAVGICASSFTNNTVVAFIAGAFVCFILYNGFDAISKLTFLKAGLDYYIEMLGINFHYRSISRGVVEVRDLIYFFGLIIFLLLITQRNLIKR
ncbi:MAG: gliding motility-associated ABC transporter permease subunit GldF, partial [Deinococcales bacterium]|nr:gliding motility-associated ABC transporter permease subunit GldF [Chitinophagaceae bacterium]